MQITREQAIAKGVLTRQEVEIYDPEFLTRRASQGADLEPTFDVEEGTVNSRFEDNILLYEVDDDGVVLFGRLHKREKPNINAILIDSERRLVGINIQLRRAAGGLFAQPVMGFALRRLMGASTAAMEADKADAIREALEENGVTVIRNVESLGTMMPNQTSFTSETTLFLLDCDSSIVTDQLDFAEGIRNAIWVTPEELWSRIEAEVFEGVRYNNGPLNWIMSRLTARLIATGRQHLLF